VSMYYFNTLSNIYISEKGQGSKKSWENNLVMHSFDWKIINL
jgi:hypothetical protein